MLIEPCLAKIEQIGRREPKLLPVFSTCRCLVRLPGLDVTRDTGAEIEWLLQAPGGALEKQVAPRIEQQHMHDAKVGLPFVQERARERTHHFVVEIDDVDDLGDGQSAPLLRRTIPPRIVT